MFVRWAIIIVRIQYGFRLLYCTVRTYRTNMGAKSPALEYEYRFSSLDFDAEDVLRRARESLGCVKKGVRSLLINTSYRSDAMPHNMVRLRKTIPCCNGSGTKKSATHAILTLKRKPAAGSKFEQENETTVADAGQMDQILRMMGYRVQHTMEKFRTVYLIPQKGELVFDENPGLPPLLEVECKSEQILNAVTKQLGLQIPDNAIFPLSDEYARVYGVTTGSIKLGDLTFQSTGTVANHIPNIKSKREFARILKTQQAERCRL